MPAHVVAACSDGEGALEARGESRNLASLALALFDEAIARARAHPGV
jgi:hypothetical protein